MEAVAVELDIMDHGLESGFPDHVHALRALEPPGDVGLALVDVQLGSGVAAVDVTAHGSGLVLVQQEGGDVCGGPDPRRP